MSTPYQLFNDFRLLVTSPNEYAASCTQQGKAFWSRIYRLMQPAKSATASRMAESVKASDDSTRRFTIAADKGYVLIQPGELPESADALTEAREIFASTDLNVVQAAIAAGRPFARLDWLPNPLSAIAQFATHPALIAPLTFYLETIPVLRAMQLMFSPNHRTVSDSSQHYHLDGQDVRSMQVFCFVEDVSEENGPLTLLDANASSKVLRAIKYRKVGAERRLQDQRVEALLDSGVRPVSIVGKAGSILIFDGDRCLHYGSRQARKARKILHYAYSSPFSFTLTAEGVRDFKRLASVQMPNWQRAVLSDWSGVTRQGRE